MFPSCQILSYFLLCCLQSQGTSDSSFATNRKGRHIDLLLKFWEREYLRDFLQSCTSLTDTTKNVSNDMMHKNHLCKFKQAKVYCIFWMFLLFKRSFLICVEEEVGGPEVNVCWEFHMQRRLDWESRSKTSIKEAKREHTNLFRISFLWAAKLLSLLSSQKVCENASLKQDWKCFSKSKTAILEVTAPSSEKNSNLWQKYIRVLI